ncbi:MAG: putative carboxyl-terminal protease [Candidatus Saccharibacteria bacterium]|nr:putative carboxyl-terminal protease [Candidatus Saccharibacteria bacterium]
MKKIEISPLVLIPSVLLFGLVAFAAGDRYSGQIALPFMKPAKEIDFSSLNDLYGMMQRNFHGEITDEKALDGAKAGLVSSGGDPYTAYLTAKEAKQLADDLTGKLSGIGAEIGIKSNVLTIVAPIEDTPADRAGLRAGDQIARINNEDTTGMSVETAVSKIRGDKGTKVTLKLVRSGVKEPFDVTITRDNITVPSVKSSMKNGNVAYINVTRFGPDTVQLVEDAARTLKGQGAKKVILDLRNDPGGYLDAAVGVSSQFLEAGALVVEEKGNQKDKLTSRGGGLLIGLPTIVLINEGSASASEIVAGALKDHKAARLVGEKSFGKGSVQEIKNLPGGAQLKVTVAHWYTPGGVNINKEGIKPDVEVKMNTDDYNANRDPQLDKALELLK